MLLLEKNVQKMYKKQKYFIIRLYQALYERCTVRTKKRFHAGLLMFILYECTQNT